MIKLYVDPGLRACGVAQFEDGRLTAAGFPAGVVNADMRDLKARGAIVTSMSKAVSSWALAPAFYSQVVVEIPQIYPRGHALANKAGTDPNDLLHLAAVVGAIGSVFASVPSVTFVLPAEWKGNMPKEIMHPRALAVLSPMELAFLPKLPKSKLHNVVDAVCMGLIDAGRLKSAGRFGSL